TPFSMVMSGFALLNAFFMFYTLVFAYKKNKVIKPGSAHSHIMYTNAIRNDVFNFFSKSALPLIILCVISCAALQFYGDYRRWGGVAPEEKVQNTINYIGVFAPNEDNGLTDIVEINKMSTIVD